MDIEEKIDNQLDGIILSLDKLNQESQMDLNFLDFEIYQQKFIMSITNSTIEFKKNRNYILVGICQNHKITMFGLGLFLALFENDMLNTVRFIGDSNIFSKELSCAVVAGLGVLNYYLVKNFFKNIKVYSNNMVDYEFKRDKNLKEMKELKQEIATSECELSILKGEREKLLKEKNRVKTMRLTK